MILAVAYGQPSPFKWGTATASYQVEGAVDRDGRLPSIWDVFCNTSNKVYMNESGAVADDDYDRFLEDIQLMKDLNLTNYRLSFAWPRILPDGKTINQAGIQHYQKVITALLSNNIEPFVTLYHWDLPQAVYQDTNGGWINESIVDYYTKYVDTVFTYFSGSVKKWLTFNEPWTFCVLGYDLGSHAPGRCTSTGPGQQCPTGNSSIEPYLCTHSVLLSHAAAVKLFREKGYDKQGGEIGITLNVDWAEPASSSDADYNASQRKLIWSLAWYADPVFFGDYPQIMKDYVGDRLPQFTEQQKQDLKGSHDFFGLNHYTSAWVKDAGKYNGSNPDWNTDQETNVNPKNQYNGTLIGVPADSSWLYVVPWGIYKMINWINNRYDSPPIYVTENGVDVPGENDMPLQQVLNDTFRTNFYKEYIGNVTKAKNDGADIRGYFAWSLMDNFEWADGYSRRFGIHFVNYTENLTRYTKDSAYWFSKYAQNNPYGDYETHLRITS